MNTKPLLALSYWALNIDEIFMLIQINSIGLGHHQPCEHKSKTVDQRKDPQKKLWNWKYSIIDGNRYKFMNENDSDSSNLMKNAFKVKFILV